MSADSSQLWPDDLQESVGTYPAPSEAGPNTDLAIMLLAAGQAPSVIKQHCGFATLAEARAFSRDPEAKARARELSQERATRCGNAALVSLERIVRTLDTQKDLRAGVLAIRTALEVSGMWKKDIAPPVKQVRELSISELTQLISDTRRELESRIAHPLPAKALALKET